MIKTPEQANGSARQLAAWKALTGNEVWRTVMEPRLRAAVTEHTAGLADRTKTAEKRAEHLEAHHLAIDLESLARREVERLERELKDWTRGESAVTREVLEAMG